MPKLQPDQLRALHAIADEKKKIRLETLKHTKRLDEAFDDD